MRFPNNLMFVCIQLTLLLRLISCSGQNIPLTKEKALGLIQKTIQEDTEKQIWYKEALDNIDPSDITLYPGFFTKNDQKQYLIYAFPNTAFAADIELKINYLRLLSLAIFNPKSKDWDIEWYTQTGGTVHIDDLDGDHLDDISITKKIVRPDDVQTIYTLITFKNGKDLVSYENEAISLMEAGGILNLYNTLEKGDTIHHAYELSFQDLNQDGINELIEQEIFGFYHGGTTLSEIRNAMITRQIKRILYLGNEGYKK